MHNEFDAVIVGSGINGLVAASMLARSGWKVALLESNPEIGGFVGSGERTVPGYVHDTFSSWYPLFVSGPAHTALGDDLARHGLRFCNTDEAVTASVADSGRASPCSTERSSARRHRQRSGDDGACCPCSTPPRNRKVRLLLRSRSTCVVVAG